ncbi:MAG: dihydropteridine reductase [Clostridia bacterium]|nr:dihydropteridine reductase [Clostridia bacterium]
MCALDRKVKTPANIFAYTFGVVGALVLGTGMCLAMKVIGNIMAVGIVIGVLGIAMVSLTYPIYKKILKSRKAKYSKEILELSEKIINN